MLNITMQDGAVRLPIKVVPGASRTRYLGEWDGRARIAVAAAPEKGRANQAVIKLIADLLAIDRRDVEIITGLTTALKMVRVNGVTVEAVRGALQER